jgi:hypothetical protein
MKKRVTDITLNATDRELVQMAARILTALDPGTTREEARDAITQAYREDVTDAHVGSSSDTLNQLTLGFGAALRLKMDRVNEDPAEMVRAASGGQPQTHIVSRSDRRRVIEAIGRYLEMVETVKPSLH